MSDLNLFIPITKVDMQTRQVWGRATQEILDAGKEIFDYTSSVPKFQRWSENVQKRSQGKSKGNLRAMHQPIAAGKLIAINFNDDDKAIDIGTYVSDDKEWEKCVDGTYTGFSVGGRYEKRWPDMQIPGAMRYTADPSEISLVDAPAVGTAVFELVKADGTSELKKFAKVEEVTSVTEGTTIHNHFYGPVYTTGEDLQKFDNIQIPGDEEEHQEPPIKEGETEGAVPPADPQLQEVESEAVIAEVDPAQPEAAAELPTESGDAVTVAEVPPDQIAKFQEAAAKLQESINQLIDLRKQEADRETKVTAELKLRGERVGIAWREGSPLTAPADHPSAWQSYGDPANFAFPMEKNTAASQIAQYNLGKGRDIYTPREWMVLGRRMARLASDVFGVAYKFSPTDAKVERIPMEKQIMTPQNPLQKDAGALLAELQASVGQAMSLVGTDPAKAMSMLTQAQAAIDVMSNVSAANPGNPNHPIAKADQPDAETKCAKCEASLTKDASFCAKCGTKVEKVDSPNEAMLKMIADQGKLIEALTDKVSKMSANPFSTLPIGDLNSILNQEPPAEEKDPLVKALNDGDLGKAFEAVNNDPASLYARMNDVIVKRISDLGINVARHGGILNVPVEG